MLKNLLHKKWLRVLILVITVLFLSIQFIRPRMDNPVVTAEIMAPGSVKMILINACYDCHSNETKLSWFDKITPANWVVADDIREGRKVLNFSEWDSLTKDQQRGELFESLNHMQFKVMPLQRYTFLHPAAKIGVAEINSMKSYLSTLMIMQRPDTAKTRAWNEQYYGWIQGTMAPRDVKPAPNGIAFMPGYKDWVAISSTERSDDGRLRIIMGNNIAVNAIKTNHINP